MTRSVSLIACVCAGVSVMLVLLHPLQRILVRQRLPPPPSIRTVAPDLHGQDRLLLRGKIADRGVLGRELQVVIDGLRRDAERCASIAVPSTHATAERILMPEPP